jgi:hypothetical protein
MDADLQYTVDWMKRTSKSYVRVDMNVVVDLADKAGSYWFSPNTMRIFGTRLPGLAILTTTGFMYFVSSDKTPSGRMYAIRLVNPETMNITSFMSCISSRERAWKMMYKEVERNSNNG